MHGPARGELFQPAGLDGHILAPHEPYRAAEHPECLQVVEQWNSNVAIHYGREPELPGADREAQEISMLTLHLLRSALVLVNTRVVDRVLDSPDRAARLTAHDLRGPTRFSGPTWPCTARSSSISTNASTTSGAPTEEQRRPAPIGQ